MISTYIANKKDIFKTKMWVTNCFEFDITLQNLRRIKVLNLGAISFYKTSTSLVLKREKQDHIYLSQNFTKLMSGTPSKQRCVIKP
jgi:hypothetical protein